MHLILSFIQKFMIIPFFISVQNNGGLNGGLSGATASRPVGAEDLTQLRNYTAPSTGEGV